MLGDYEKFKKRYLCLDTRLTLSAYKEKQMRQ